MFRAVGAAPAKFAAAGVDRRREGPVHCALTALHAAVVLLAPPPRPRARARVDRAGDGPPAEFGFDDALVVRRCRAAFLASDPASSPNT